MAEETVVLYHNTGVAIMLNSETSFILWRSKLDGEIDNLILTNKLDDAKRDQYLLNIIPSRVSDDILFECPKLGIGTTTGKTLLSDIERAWKSKQNVSLQTLIQNPINTRADVEQMVVVLRKLLVTGFTPEAVITTCMEAIPDIVIRNQLLLSSDKSDLDGFICNLRKIQWQQYSSVNAVISLCKTCKKRHPGKCWKLMKCFRCGQMGHVQKFCSQAPLN